MYLVSMQTSNWMCSHNIKKITVTLNKRKNQLETNDTKNSSVLKHSQWSNSLQELSPSDHTFSSPTAIISLWPIPGYTSFGQKRSLCSNNLWLQPCTWGFSMFLKETLPMFYEQPICIYFGQCQLCSVFIVISIISMLNY